MTLYMIERERAWVGGEALYIFEDRDEAVKKYNEIERNHVDRFFISLTKVTTTNGVVTGREYYDVYADEFSGGMPDNKARTMLKEIQNMFSFYEVQTTELFRQQLELQEENDKLKRAGK